MVGAGGKPPKDIRESSKGTDLVASVVVGMVLGYFCRRWFPSTGPWGFLIFLFLGIAAGFWRLFRSE
jgi:F0F1-type ATP synthase assembly protein I